MKRTKKLTSLLLAGVLAVGLAAPAGQAQAADIQPLPFPTYINGSQVTINNSLLYGGHTYVQLRELANVTNMGVDFNSADNPMLPVPGGSLPVGISIDQPTFVYVKDNVQDWSSGSAVILDKAVDITTLYSRYQSSDGYRYGFDGQNLVVPNGKGGSDRIQLHVIASYGKYYVSVGDFRDKVQPYLIDMCMQ